MYFSNVQTLWQGKRAKKSLKVNLNFFGLFVPSVKLTDCIFWRLSEMHNLLSFFPNLHPTIQIQLQVKYSGNFVGGKLQLPCRMFYTFSVVYLPESFYSEDSKHLTVKCYVCRSCVGKAYFIFCFYL